MSECYLCGEPILDIREAQDIEMGAALVPAHPRCAEEELAKRREKEAHRPKPVHPALATVLGMAAALAPEPRPGASIPPGYVCTACGGTSHAPDCRPPRGMRKA